MEAQKMKMWVPIFLHQALFLFRNKKALFSNKFLFLLRSNLQVCLFMDEFLLIFIKGANNSEVFNINIHQAQANKTETVLNKDK